MGETDSRGAGVFAHPRTCVIHARDSRASKHPKAILPHNTGGPIYIQLSMMVRLVIVKHPKKEK